MEKKKRRTRKPKSRPPKRLRLRNRFRNRPNIRKLRKKSKRRASQRTRRSRTPRIKLIPPRQVAVRAQEAAFQLLVAVDRGGLIHRFLRWYANERKRPGRISNPGRYHELVETIRRESFLVLALQVDADAPQRLGVRSPGKMSPAQSELVDLFHEEFYVALGRSLDLSDEDFNDFCRDLDVYRRLLHRAPGSPTRIGASSMPAGPFVDRCGFLLDSPMLDQGRQAAARFESELRATASSIIKKVFSRRRYL